jgi:hypothetical protein
MTRKSRSIPHDDIRTIDADAAKICVNDSHRGRTRICMAEHSHTGGSSKAMEFYKHIGSAIVLYLGGVGLANVVDGNAINPAVLTTPGSEISHVLHDLKQ